MVRAGASIIGTACNTVNSLVSVTYLTSAICVPVPSANYCRPEFERVKSAVDASASLSTDTALLQAKPDSN